MTLDTTKMLRQLGSSMKELDKARKIQDKVLSEMVSQLPDDKRKQANDLINKARKGISISVSEMMAFTGDIRSIDKDEIERSIKRAEAKEKEVMDK